MSEFEAVGVVADFPDPSSTLVEVDDTPVVLIHAAGRFHALDDVCTHDGGPLSDGDLCLDDEKPSIVCPRHGAKFAVDGGAALTMPATKATVAHDAVVEDGVVKVRLNS